MVSPARGGSVVTGSTDALLAATSVLDNLKAPGAVRSTVTQTSAPQLHPIPVQPSGAAAVEESGEESQGLFPWTKQWYPLAVVAHLDAAKPHSVQLLGRDLVLWCAGPGDWRCFEDACPHRKVPLSEGRVEADGTLLCAYHAWRFDASGRCVAIPQSLDGATQARHCANPRACALAFPTQQQLGLVWVWGEGGPQAERESRQRGPNLVQELVDDPALAARMTWNQRDLPYGWEFFMENVADPAHVPVSHHGLVGNRYTDARYYDMERRRPMETQGGFSYAITPSGPGISEAVHDFQPPCLMRIATRTADGAGLVLVLYATPTRPGWCRHFGSQVLLKSPSGRSPRGLAFFSLPLPAWLLHVLGSLFLHQDLVFLHYQQRILAAQPEEDWQQVVFTPNPQDKMVIALRHWLRHRAGGGIPWQAVISSAAPAPPGREQLAPLGREQLFDVWHTHTQHCTACLGAYRRIQRLIGVGWILAVLSLAAGILAASATIPIPMTAGWILIAAAPLLALAAWGLQRFSGLFRAYEFEHAQND
jgi:phenylpropionate dioxygenase-like ring-hydroxylating dioxygenase large terminal subunit